MAHFAAGCGDCQQRLAWLSEVVAVTAQDDSFVFSEVVIARIVAQFKGRMDGERAPLRQLVAQLIFDSLFPAPFAEAREGLSSPAPASRQMLFRTEEYDIDLRFEKSDGTAGDDLIGQVMAAEQSRTDPGPVLVRLLREGETAAQTRTNARGVFRFSALPPGVYDLRIYVADGEIRLDRLATTMGI
ncbi:MAG: carboxypeptidase-like regulatory domain-containing protein [Blastocatellia bacterium]|nr:carboxypeptidase-like regulatory domain-containing protein [Blastocatellia bacterium]